MFDKFLSDSDKEISSSIVAVLDGKLPTSRLSNSDGGYEEEAKLWPEFVSLGWSAIGLSEEAGGVAAGVMAEVACFREFGRFLLSPAILATTTAAIMAEADGQMELARSLIGDEGSVGWGFMNNGRSVLPGFGATKFVLTSSDNGLSLYSGDGISGVSDAWRLDDTLPMSSWAVEPQGPMLSASRQSQPFARLLLLGAAMLTGMSEATLALATEHAINRKQFGRQIGSFQAIKHMCADMAVDVATAGAQLASAAGAAEGRGEMDEIYAAALLSSAAAKNNASRAIQIFGGMGFTAECPVQLYLKRSIVLTRMLPGRASVHQGILQRFDLAS
jgi:alkylation response protein AidB-like acyl-CoA dehydrogenase